MANEATKIEDGYVPAVMRTILNATAVEKGTLMELNDNNIVNVSSGSGVFGGVANAEKVASDGAVKIGCDMDGVYDMTTAPGAAITVGQLVSLSGANLIKTATEAEIAAGKAVGKAEETSTLASSEVIRVRLLGF